MRDERLIKGLICGFGGLLALAVVVLAVVLATQPPTTPEITRSTAPTAEALKAQEEAMP